MPAEGRIVLNVVAVLRRQVVEFADKPVGRSRIPFSRVGIAFRIENSTACRSKLNTPLWKKKWRVATLRNVGVMNRPQYSALPRRSVRSGPHIPRSNQAGSLLAGIAGLRGAPSPSTIYLYVADVDATDRCALDARATSLHGPEDHAATAVPASSIRPATAGGSPPMSRTCRARNWQSAPRRR
jgi:hypothetical protein